MDFREQGLGINRPGSTLGSARCGGQQNFECRSLSLLTFNTNASAVLFHDCLHSEEAQSGSFAFALGAEEGFENVGAGFAVHSNSCVFHQEQNIVSGRRTRTRGGGRDNMVGKLDDQFSTAEHRVAGIIRKIQENLLNSAAVNSCLMKIGSSHNT